MKDYPTSVTKLISALAALPGVGQKTAERYALFLLKQEPAVSKTLSDAIAAARGQVRSCRVCFNLAEAELCAVCSDASRDKTQICVVESPRELLTIERSGVWKGIYHCLCGRIAPSEGITESDLTISQLRRRCANTNHPVTEVVIATNPDLGGDATALAVARALGDLDISVTRLARGVPVGYQLDFLSGNVLDEAFTGRQPLLRRAQAQTQAAKPPQSAAPRPPAAAPTHPRNPAPQPPQRQPSRPALDPRQPNQPNRRGGQA